jgi:hypothetical protein
MYKNHDQTHFNHSLFLMMLRRTLLSTSLLLASFIAPAFAGFGVKESGNSFEVDTDGGLVFTGS